MKLVKESQKFYFPLNRNIGCIEILFSLPNMIKIVLLNRNIGCIEIPQYFHIGFCAVPLNRNIGCIEILINKKKININLR